MSSKRALVVCAVVAAMSLLTASAYAAPPGQRSNPSVVPPASVVHPDTAIKTNLDGFNLQVFGTALHVDQIWVGFVGGLLQSEWCGNVAWSVNGAVVEDSEFHICAVDNGFGTTPDWGYENVNQNYSDGTVICEVIVHPDSGFGGSLTSLPCATVHS